MEVNGYNLTRAWFDWRFENPDKGSFKHAEIYFFIIDLWNRLGQKEKIGLPVNNLKEALSIGNRNTIYTALRDLEEWGFIKTISEAKNQNQSRIISLTACTLYEQPGEQALDQAHEQASEQPGEQAGEHIIKQYNKGTTEQININEWLRQNFPEVYKLEKKPTPENIEFLKLNYGESAVEDILNKMDNYKKLTKSYKDVYKTALNWLKKAYGPPKKELNGEASKSAESEMLEYLYTHRKKENVDLAIQKRGIERVYKDVKEHNMIIDKHGELILL